MFWLIARLLSLMKIKDIFLFFAMKLIHLQTLSTQFLCHRHIRFRFIDEKSLICDFAGKTDLIGKWISCASIFHLFVFIFFSMYSFVLPGGEIHPHDRVDAGGPPTCVDYRHAGGRENLPSTGKVVGSKERKIVSRLFVKNNMLICWFFFFLPTSPICNCYENISTTNVCVIDLLWIPRLKLSSGLMFVSFFPRWTFDSSISPTLKSKKLENCSINKIPVRYI